MRNIIRVDFKRTFHNGRTLCILLGCLISVGVMMLEVKMMGALGSDDYSAAGLMFAGNSMGVFSLCLCLFTMSMIMVDYEYGNIKNICSVTSRRSMFIESKLIYAYCISLFSSVLYAIIITGSGFLFLGNHTEIGSPIELLISIAAYSFICDVPITIIALFASMVKRNAYCTYIVLAMYFLPNRIYAVIDKFTGISLKKYSALCFAFQNSSEYDIKKLAMVGGLSIIYTVILFGVTVKIVNRRDVL